MRWFPLFLLLSRGFAQEVDPAAFAAEVRRFAQVYALVESHAAEKIDGKAAFENGALPGAMRKLDPHSVFFNKDQFEQLREMQTSTQKGFGSVVSVLPGRVILLQTLPGSPSERAGLSPGDEIIAINGIALSRFDIEQMVEYLGYTRQREALLTVRRENFPRPLEFRLSPASLNSPSVERAFALEKGIGYIRVASFESKTGKDFEQAVEKLGGESLRGLVVDLRNNPGGVFTSALEMAALFLPPGTTITSIRGRARQEEVIRVPEKTPRSYGFPVTILVNEKSASASEVFTAALQEHGRATVYGQRTYGKGLVQSVFPLAGNTGMALTTAYYYTPKGRSLQRKLSEAQIDPTLNPGAGGLAPDVEVVPPPPTRLQYFLDGNAVFTAYASEWAKRNPKPAEDWQLPLQELDRLRTWLGEKNVFPTLADWNRDRDWMRHRLEQEILNLSVGVERGDEVEIRNDRTVLAAWEKLRQP